MARTQRFAWLVVPALVGALVGFGLYHHLTSASEDAVDLAARDLRVRDPNPIRSHHAPPTTPSLDVPAGEVDPERRGLAPAIELAPRDAAEWQGMLVNTTFQASCDTSTRCGLAMACHAGRCGACTRDAECGAGEVCSMQHCVASASTACRTRADCPSGELCMLTGYSDDPRGNGDMRSYCSGSPPQIARTVESDEAALAQELASADVVPLPVDNPATPEGLVHLLQDR
jgi:hypothetical protein